MIRATSVRSSSIALMPKRGRKLIVLFICRISSVHQDLQSLDDQRALCLSWLQRNTQLEYEVTVVAGRGSGENLERDDYQRACAEIETGKYDLVVVEDLGRICRRIHALIFCEECEDRGTRLIAINDGIDTAEEGWRMSSFFAAIKHEVSNADTAKRIRRTLRNRFMEGGVVQTTIVGYIKPPGSSRDSELRKDPAFEPIYDHWFQMLEDGARFAEVADWLNTNQVPVGKYARRPSWTGTMVARVTRNSILKGLRVRNKKITQRVNRTGKSRTIEAPAEERLERSCPHLAFIEPQRYDRVLRLVRENNKQTGRKKSDNSCNRPGSVWKQTRWPGQHLTCAICGNIYYWGGTEGRRILVCSGAHNYRCWNALTFDAALLTKRLLAGIWERIQSLPEFDQVFISTLEAKIQELVTTNQSRAQLLEKKRDLLNRQITHIANAIAETGISAALKCKLSLLEEELADTESEILNILSQPKMEVAIPCMSEVRKRAAELFEKFVPEDMEMARVLRRLLPQMAVMPCRICDIDGIFGRALIKMNLAALLPSDTPQSTLPAMTVEFCIPLFDEPQRVRHLGTIREFVRAGLTQRQMGAQVGMFQSAVQATLQLIQVMDAEQLTDPYIDLLDPPKNSKRFKRHLHPRYRFEPRCQTAVLGDESEIEGSGSSA